MKPVHRSTPTPVGFSARPIGAAPAERPEKASMGVGEEQCRSVAGAFANGAALPVAPGDFIADPLSCRS
jgi:hypothetical protein